MGNLRYSCKGQCNSIRFVPNRLFFYSCNILNKQQYTNCVESSVILLNDSFNGIHSALFYGMHFDSFCKQNTQQECIPVGRVPAAAIAVRGVLHHPPARSPSTSPLGVGLDQIPSTSPLGVGLDQIPHQLPPCVWAWRAPPPSQIPLNFPLGSGPGNLQGMLPQSRYPPPGTRYSPRNRAPWDQTPSPFPLNRILDTRL